MATHLKQLPIRTPEQVAGNSGPAMYPIAIGLTAVNDEQAYAVPYVRMIRDGRSVDYALPDSQVLVDALAQAVASNVKEKQVSDGFSTKGWAVGYPDGTYTFEQA